MTCCEIPDGLREALCVPVEQAEADLDLVSRLATMSTWYDDVETLMRVKKILEERLKWIKR